MLETEYKFGEVHSLADQIRHSSDRPQFHRIFGNNNGGVVLIALKAGQELTEHLAPAEIMVYVLNGSIEFTMFDKVHVLNAGEFILVGEGVPHSVVAMSDAKVMLVKVKA